MQLLYSTLEKTFGVKNKGRIYYVSYLNSDGQILGVSNRFNWEVLNEDLEELDIYSSDEPAKEKKEQVMKNAKLREYLIKFCIKHFNDYQPDYKND